MNRFIALSIILFSCILLTLHHAPLAGPDASVWKITPSEYFEAPGASVLVYHDFYPEGKQGGVEIIQHGERVAADGDVRLEETPGQWSSLPKIGKREVNAAAGVVKVSASFDSPKLNYSVRVEAKGDSIRVSVDLDQPLPSDLEGKVSFNLELFPAAYFGKTFRLGNKADIFPRQGNGPMKIGGNGKLQPLPLGVGQKLVIAAEDPLRSMVIESLKGDLGLFDGRDTAENGWFVVRSLLRPNTSQGASEWIITPHRIPNWRREPVIAYSQVGYHPDQVKQAIIELDPQSGDPTEAALYRVNPDGKTDKLLSTPAKPWNGKFLRYKYAIFDFTQVREQGLYYLKYQSQTTSPFRISPDVYQNAVWQPTLETYFPVQMCHMEVRDGYRVWHGACHLDDAIQAPAGHKHFDSYEQSPVLPDSFAAYQHIPYLDQGGWHDAGDYDLAAGSQAHTTLMLSLVRETFEIESDQTTVDKRHRRVLLHTPDGIPDVVQQIEHGVESLLSGYRAAGHSFSGIIEGSLEQYVHLGDPVTMTDNRVYDPSLSAEEVKGERSGKRDDRWAFTSRDTALEYQVATALAAASRVLRPYNETLAKECVDTAIKSWEREQGQTPVIGPSAYVPRRPDIQEIYAAVELLKTTGEARFRDRLIALSPTIEKNFGEIGWTVARVLPLIKDDSFVKQFNESIKREPSEVKKSCSTNPFGVPWDPAIWGIGWQIQDYAVKQYFLLKANPRLFDRESILRVLNYVLGCHPGSNVSFVSGVGARSLTNGYGFNRADWSYIAGMNASGTALIRPDFPELKDNFPFLWQQAENVIGGAATYIFTVLAADQLLNGK